jgi:hypothetical protein
MSCLSRLILAILQGLRVYVLGVRLLLRGVEWSGSLLRPSSLAYISIVGLGFTGILVESVRDSVFDLIDWA